MNEELYKVLVQVDDASRVTAINSGAFISDETGWTVVDVGTGDRYHHAQNNYLTYPLIDDRGVYRYKFVDGMVVQRTQTEMDTDYTNQPDPEPSEEEKGLEEMGSEVDRIREIALRGMVKLCHNTEDPAYDALKKIFQFCDKANEKKEEPAK